MPHVDETLLVAYADNALSPSERAAVEAHLVSCAPCRARVEEERALAQRAAAVLGLGALPGHAAAPPFEEILRRSDRPDATTVAAAQRPGQRRAWPPLAWAAMVIVALGAGWIARVLLFSPEFTAPVERAESDASAGADAASMPAESATPADAGAARPDAAAQEQTAAAPQSDTELPAPQALDTRARGEETEAAVVPAPPPAAPSVAAAESIAELPTVAARVAPDSIRRTAVDAPAQRMAVEADAAQPETGIVTGRVRNAETNEPLVGGQVSVAGTSLGALTDRSGEFVIRNVPAGAQTLNVAIIGFGSERRAVAVAPDSTVTAEVALRPSAVALEALTVTGTAFGAVAIDEATAAWRGATLQDAAVRGARVRAIADAPVELIWLGAAEAPWRARVVQRIDGAALEVVEWRSLAPGVAGTSGTLDDGRNYLFTSSGGSPILLRSTLSLERLRSLAAALRLLP